MSERLFGKISTKPVKVNTDFFSYSVFVSFNNNVNTGVLTDKLKHAGIKTVYKKHQEIKGEISDLQAIYKTYQNPLKIVSTMNTIIILIRYPQNINADFDSTLYFHGRKATQKY